MGNVDPKVARSFETDLQNALAALKRWEEHCAEAQEDYKNTHQTTISEAIKESEAARGTQLSNFPSQKPKPRFDLTKRKPLTPAMAKEMGLTGGIEQRKKKCDETIEKLRKTIERLNNARTTGAVTIQNLRVGIHDKPKFISKVIETVSRGEMLLVLEKKNNWFRVRTAGGKEGWIARSDIGESLPVELTSAPGTAKKMTPQEQKEYDKLSGAPSDRMER